MNLLKKIHRRLKHVWTGVCVFFTHYPEESDVKSQWHAYYLLTKKLDWCSIKWSENEIPRTVPDDVIINKTIFVYWKQGFDKAPEIVRKCVASIKNHCGDYNVVYLDSSNLMNYVCIPQHIIDKHDKGIIKEAFFSDLVRTNLLIRYGGIWCDATCFWVKDIPNYINDSKFFLFRSPMLGKVFPGEISNWFIKSEQGNELLLETLNLLYEWWRRYDSVCHYYIYHLTLSAIVNHQLSIQEWTTMPYVNNMDPHTFYYHWDCPFEDKLYSQLLESCFIQKLSYKFPVELLYSKPVNMLQAFMATN